MVRERNMESLWQLNAGFVMRKDYHQDVTKRKTLKSNKNNNSINQKNMNNRKRKASHEEGGRKIHKSKNDRKESEEMQASEGASQPNEDIGGSLTREATSLERPQAVPDRYPKYNTRNNPKNMTIQELVLYITQIEIEESPERVIPGEIMCYKVLYPKDNTYKIFQDVLMAYKATADPDTMYKQEDKAEVLKTMVKKMLDQLENGNFTLIKRSQVPEGEKILPAIWQMKRKRDIKTRKVKKYKARLNIDE